MEKLYYEIHDHKGSVNITANYEIAMKAMKNEFIVVEVQESMIYTPDTVIRTTVSRKLS
jgi:hypothetical protein